MCIMSTDLFIIRSLYSLYPLSLCRNMKRFSYPLIFIVSESQSSGSSRLFPSLITSELDIYNIK